ncbi:hypothetical protein F4801DRAFT_548576 [Xylaria longipes]|nr:hypothetical protein F4801DRAFT_548576 [Xylaria longipes]
MCLRFRVDVRYPLTLFPALPLSRCPIHLGQLWWSFTGTTKLIRPTSWTMLKREQIRARFGIPGTPLNDYCVSFWCQCCAIIQHDNEVATRMPKPLDLLKTQPLPMPDMSMPGTST